MPGSRVPREPTTQGPPSARKGPCPVRHVASSPLRAELTADQGAGLESRRRSYTLPYWQVVRAKLVLMAAGGVAKTEIAERLGTSPQVVHRWLGRSAEQGVDGRADRDRPGRPPVFGAAVV